MAPYPLLDIVIVGAGPAGNTAAAALAQDGHKVTVLERHSDLQTRGGNLILQPPAVKCLAEIGVTSSLDPFTLDTTRHLMWNWKGERPFADVTATPDGLVRKPTERPAVQRVTYEAAIALGATYLFGQQVISLQEEQGGRITASTANGQEYSADLVVGADGIKSITRKLMFQNQDVRAVVTPEVIYQTEVAQSLVAADPVASPLSSMTHHFLLGPDRYCIGRPTPDGKIRLLLCNPKYDMQGGNEEVIDDTWNSDGNPEDVRDQFKMFNAPLRAYIECVIRGGHPIDKWRIAVAPRMDTWLGLGGHCLLIGDAAHAMVPHNAMGISTGIEDGLALSTTLRWAKSRDEVPQLLQCWEALRKPRGEKFVDISNSNIKMFTLPDGPEQEARDRRLATTGITGTTTDWDNVVADENAPPMTPEFTKWKLYYDVVEETNKFVASRTTQALANGV